MSFDRRMKYEQVDPEEVWSAIQYLDPDKKDSDTAGNTATILALLGLVILVCAAWGLLWFKVR